MNESKKLVDILARGLVHWPAGVVTAVQDLDGEVKFDDSNEKPQLTRDKSVWIRQGDGGDEVQLLETADDYTTAIVTRAEWQAARDALKGEAVAPAWDGRGHPPAGTVCTLKTTAGTANTAEIMYSSSTALVWRWKGLADEFGSEWQNVEVTPIRTAEQIEAEKRRVAIAEMVAGPLKGRISAMESAADLYEAGYRKQVEK